MPAHGTCCSSKCTSPRSVRGWMRYLPYLRYLALRDQFKVHCRAELVQMLTSNATPASWSRRTAVLPRASGSISPIGRKARKAQQAPQHAPSSQPTTSTSSPSLPQLPRLPVPMPSSTSSPSYDILEAFFYGRAFATVLSKRLGEAVVDAVAEVSRAAAERPQRIRDFQEEVAALARKELADAGAPVRGQPAGSSKSNSASGNGTGAAAAKSEPQDLQAVVDDLRAEIAYSRAILQQLRASGKVAAPPKDEQSL